MRRVVFQVLVCAFAVGAVLLFAVGGSQARASATRPHTSPGKPPARCAIVAVTRKADLRVVEASGHCVLHSRSVPQAWTWVANGVDAAGVACGKPVSGKGTTAYLSNDLPYRSTVTFR